MLNSAQGDANAYDETKPRLPLLSIGSDTCTRSGIGVAMFYLHGVRKKSTVKFRIISSQTVEPETGVLSDERIEFTGHYSKQKYLNQLRLIHTMTNSPYKVPCG